MYHVDESKIFINKMNIVKIRKKLRVYAVYNIMYN